MRTSLYFHFFFSGTNQDAKAGSEIKAPVSATLATFHSWHWSLVLKHRSWTRALTTYLGQTIVVAELVKKHKRTKKRLELLFNWRWQHCRQSKRSKEPPTLYILNDIKKRSVWNSLVLRGILHNSTLEKEAHEDQNKKNFIATPRHGIKGGNVVNARAGFRLERCSGRGKKCSKSTPLWEMPLLGWSWGICSPAFALKSHRLGIRRRVLVSRILPHKISQSEVFAISEEVSLPF